MTRSKISFLVKKWSPLRTIKNTTYKNLLVEDSKLGIQIVTIDDEPQQGRLHLDNNNNKLMFSNNQRFPHFSFVIILIVIFFLFLFNCHKITHSSNNNQNQINHISFQVFVYILATNLPFHANVVTQKNLTFCKTKF